MNTFRFCPYCKTTLEEKEGNKYCPSCDRFFYPDSSKPTASVMLIKDGQILLTKRAIEPFKGKYGLVGGFMWEAETPQEGAIREAKEEIGLDIRLLRLFGTYLDKNYYEGGYTLNIYFVGEIAQEGNLQPMDDVAELHWFPIENLPEDIAFPNTRQVLQDFQREYLANKRKPPAE